MLPAALEVLRCPECREGFECEPETRCGEDVVTGSLVCACGRRVAIENGIPRFVPPENYAGNFGFQWTRFAELQVDRLQGNTMSRDRFYLQLGRGPESLAGLRVLEAGCGGGRFSDIVLEAGAELYSVDLSNAVDKNRELHKEHPRHHVVQSSILDLPLRAEAFDLVFCFGVIQHTPDPAQTFRSLVPFVKPGGSLAVDVYAAHPKQVLHWKYALRPLTRRMSDETLLRWTERATRVFLPAARVLRRIPKAGKALTRLVPLKIHDGILVDAPQEKQHDLAVLETFDALSPAYDRPRSRRTLQRWFDRAGLQAETFTLLNGLNYGRGIKPTTRHRAPAAAQRA